MQDVRELLNCPITIKKSQKKENMGQNVEESIYCTKIIIIKEA